MFRRFSAFILICPVLAAIVLGQNPVPPQDPVPLANAGDAAAPPSPKGLDVLARGPIHEAFATPTTDPAPTPVIPKRPPAPIEELPPEEKPEGNVSWIGGYWAWDDERNDFLWVSGTWRTPPPGKNWVSGYWKENGDSWQWAPGFWSNDNKPKDEVTAAASFLPQAPPATPQVAAPPPPPNVAPTEVFYIPGNWTWNGVAYLWRAGYWARVQPGYVWVPSHYRWTPAGTVFIPGYWDLAVAQRGVLYAPVTIDPVVRVSFQYTPCYAVGDTLVLDTLFIRPAYCHYYFGDYYGPAYGRLGFESCVVYSGSHYDAIFVYERARRPDWVSVQITLCNDRHFGRALPPRTLMVNGAFVAGGVGPAARIVAAGGGRMVRLDAAARRQVMEHAVAARERAVARVRTEEAVRRAGPAAAGLHRPVGTPVGHAPAGQKPLNRQPLQKQTPERRPAPRDPKEQREKN